MKILQPVGRFLIYSNLFIAICACLMVIQTFQLVLHLAPDPYLLGFIFFSTICSYSFHWWLSSEPTVTPSPRTSWQLKHKHLHLAFFVFGLIGAGIFFLYLIEYWIWLLPAVFITFLYSAPKIPDRRFRALRKVAIGKTVFLTLVWTYVTALLPLLVNEARIETEGYLFTVSRFFFIYAICILFDYRDREDDRAKGIRSLITFLSEKGIRNLFVLSLALFAIFTIALWWYGLPVLDIILILLPGAIAAIAYPYATRRFSDLLYYFVLDGLMALSSLLTIMTRI
ncbi:MAG: UbiA family prenyltransferase [Chitinophagaceae bacterium]|nr:UbiA family prenyltransferase [Chitinophagaceae bacterium]